MQLLIDESFAEKVIPANDSVRLLDQKEDHMRNAQLKPGHNLQFGVEGEYITGVDISSERSDQLTLIPLLEQMRVHTGAVYGDVTCDAGYESEENYTYFQGSTTCCYIKPQNYERSKTRKFKNNMALRENMKYDAVLDPAKTGKSLPQFMRARVKANQALKARLPTMSVRIAHCVLIKRAVPERKGTASFKYPRISSVNAKNL